MTVLVTADDTVFIEDKQSLVQITAKTETQGTVLCVLSESILFCPSNGPQGYYAPRGPFFAYVFTFLR